jgi:superfamily II DNA/RNA helicase
MDQRQRMATLDAFRSGALTLLAASDVAARGLDIPEVSHVFNFDVPIVADDYVHRIGRTGRAGRQGFSATIVTDDDMRTLRDIERIIKAPVEWVGTPPPEDAGTKAGKRKRLQEAGAGRDEWRNGRRDGRRGRGDRPGGDRRRYERDQGPPGLAEPAAPMQTAAPAPEIDTDTQPTVATWPQAETVAVRDRREPRRHRGERPRRRDDLPGDERRQPAAADEARPREARRSRSEKSRQSQPQRERVVGMGDHVPAFMRRPPRGGTPEQDG